MSDPLPLIFETHDPAVQTPREPATVAPIRRAGGLPLPGKSAPRDVRVFVAADVVRWDCRFPTIGDGHRTVEAMGTPARRAGGLPMPGR